MTLVFDGRASLEGGPGFHALIGGISAYPHIPGGGGMPASESFGLRQLSAAALSAYKLYRWLLEHQARLPVPLATVRLLLSPSESEVQVEPGIETIGAERCTRRNFAAEAWQWRKDASSHNDNMTLFYSAGHGVQLSRSEAVIFLEDFGNPDAGLLQNAVSIQNLYSGMAPPADPKRKRARTQFYFVDASSTRIHAIERHAVPDIFDVELSVYDDRRAPIFYAAAPGGVSYAISHEQSLFNKALLQCLDGAAAEFIVKEGSGEEVWAVSVTSLMRGLITLLEQMNKNYQLEQTVTVSGTIGNTIICYLDRPPLVKVSLEIDPPEMLPFTDIEIIDDTERTLLALQAPITPYPYICDLPAGYYMIRVKTQGTSSVRARLIMPPSVDWKIKVDAS